MSTREGAITVHATEPGPRPLPAGTIDAGGPYGGPTTFEGVTITFTVTTSDPAILFFRWDFNNDSIFDYPNQTGGGLTGKWTTRTSVAWRLLDDSFGNVVVEGWDGVSTRIQIQTGDNLGEITRPYWYVEPANAGWEFTAKSTMQVTELGAYQWFHQGPYGAQVRIWDTVTRTTLAMCTPRDIPFQWNWCTLSTPITLLAGRTYRIAEHKTADQYPYFMAFYGPPGTLPPWSPPVPEKIRIGDFFYTWTSPYAYPATDGGNRVIVGVDFRWREVQIVPDSVSDTATLEVNNVAPTVIGLSSSPSPSLEWGTTTLTATFDDPGLNDTWEYRWTLPGGVVSDWRPVSKTLGGARILFLHTWSSAAARLESAVQDMCGSFCVRIDDFDWGPTGQNTVPPLSTLLKYDVLVVGTNYFVANTTAMGNRLADYMDAGGNVVMTQFGFDNGFGCLAGICGRWERDMYNPIPRGYSYGGSARMGRIYVPGHPLLDGVSSMNTTGYSAVITSVNPGATRIVDWDDGRVLAAVRTNPVVNNGARAVALNYFPASGYGNIAGDYVRMVVNAIRWASRQPDPTPKPMPIDTDPFPAVFRDDSPTTTPQDDVTVSVEVRDDDHGRMKVTREDRLYFEDFQSPAHCSWTNNSAVWPPGWSAVPPTGWRCQSVPLFPSRGPSIFYYYNDPAYGTGNGTSNLFTNSFDFGGYDAVRVEFDTMWRGDYPSGSSDGRFDASLDGGVTFPLSLVAYHHGNPGSFDGHVSVETAALGGQATVVFRFRYVSGDDWYWYVDNVRVTGVKGEVILGLGSLDGTVTIANVPPTAGGGFDAAQREPDGTVLFDGFRISDPALLEPTEWFAYAWDFGDGTPVNWTYVGSLAPPRADVLIVHSLCLGGNGCTDYTDLRDALAGLDDVGTVDGFNFLNYPGTPTAPSLDTLLLYDVIVVATNWAYFSNPAYDAARRNLGDRLAAYIDLAGGGVLTTMSTYDLAGTGDIFTLLGRYADEDYGPFETATYVASDATLGTIYEPDHPVMDGVRSGHVTSRTLHSGDYATTVGGSGAANGRNGTLLADWEDGDSAIGVKELNSGMRTAHLGAFAAPGGDDAQLLLRNLIGWLAGGIPTPKIAPIRHQFGNDPSYTVDLMLIDDDMGWTWNVAANAPEETLPPATVSHRFITIT